MRRGRMWAISAVRAALVLALVSTLSGCGETGPTPPTAPDEELLTGPVLASVSTIARSQPGPGLDLTVQLPAGGADCASRPRARVEAREHGYLYLATTVTSVNASYCTDVTTAVVHSPVDLNRLDLVVNDEAWKPGPDGTFVRCSTEVGCHPPEDRCAPVWTHLVTAEAELPPEQSVDVLACTKHWLVLDVDAVVTGCQSVDGSTPPTGCDDAGVHTRWFAELGPDRRWTVVASSREDGCREVVAQVPQFPRALCEGLPAR